MLLPEKAVPQNGRLPAAPGSRHFDVAAITASLLYEKYLLPLTSGLLQHLLQLGVFEPRCFVCNHHYYIKDKLFPFEVVPHRGAHVQSQAVAPGPHAPSLIHRTTSTQINERC